MIVASILAWVAAADAGSGGFHSGVRVQGGEWVVIAHLQWFVSVVMWQHATDPVESLSSPMFFGRTVHCSQSDKSMCLGRHMHCCPSILLRYRLRLWVLAGNLSAWLWLLNILKPNAGIHSYLCAGRHTSALCTHFCCCGLCLMASPAAWPITSCAFRGARRM